MRCCALVLLSLALLGCTGPINEETTRDMPVGYMCELLGPDYLTMPPERRALHAEIERRGQSCPVAARRAPPFVPVVTPLAPPPPMIGAPAPYTGITQTRCRAGMAGGINCVTM